MKFFSGLCIDIPRLFSFEQKITAFFFFRISFLIQKNFCNLIYFHCIMKQKSLFFNPMIGEIVNTANFLVKINTIKKTNVIRKFSFFFELKKIIKFRKYFDFHYIPSSTDKFFFSNERKTEKKKKNRLCMIENIFVPIDIIPLFFLKYSEFKIKINENVSSFIKKKCSSTLLKEIYREKNRIPILGIDRRSFPQNKQKLDFLIDFKKGMVPLISDKKVQKELFNIPLFSIGLLIKLFKKRPIWTLEILDSFFPPSLKRYLKKTLPTVCYRFYGINPYRKAWIRNGYDPRGNRKSRIYQTLDLRNLKLPINKTLDKLNFYKNSKKTKDFLKKKKTKKKEKRIIEKYLLGKKFHKNILFIQICDIPNLDVKQILIQRKKKNFSYFIHFYSGWFSREIIKKFKSIC